jgi:hypothetical protein
MGPPHWPANKWASMRRKAADTIAQLAGNAKLLLATSGVYFFNGKMGINLRKADKFRHQYSSMTGPERRVVNKKISWKHLPNMNYSVWGAKFLRCGIHPAKTSNHRVQPGRESVKN